MSEPGTHSHLHARLLAEMRSRFAPEDDLCILVDDASLPADQRPHAIGGKVPDVYIRSVASSRVTALGEAKTATDVDNGHTRLQLAAYFEFLKHQPSPYLVLAVPWHRSRLMAGIAAKIQVQCQASNVTVIVFENLPG